MARKSSTVSLERDNASHKRDSQADPFKEAFGSRLRETLERLGLPDSYFAKLARIPTSTFSRYKAGQAIPKADDIFPLSDVLGVAPRWLMFGDTGTSSSVADVRDAEWVSIPRYRLMNLTDTGKGDPIETVPYRKDWLNRRLGTSSGLWITELPSDYDALGLEEGDAIICADIDAAGPAEKWICIFRGTAGPFVARYSNRGVAGELDSPDAIFVTAADLQGGDVFAIARVRARMLAKL